MIWPIYACPTSAPARKAWPFFKDIAGDLSSRRGQVTGTKGMQTGVLAITGLAPLVELDGYSARLKSVTGGQGSWTMQLSHYEPAPANLQLQLSTEYRKSRKHEED